MAKPIEVFKTQKQLDSCLKWWMKKLFLNNWIIEASFVHREEIPGLAGQSDSQWVNMCGVIKLLYYNEIPEGIIHQSQEQVLVHELLHFKYMSFTGHGMKYVFFDEMQHQLLEQMSRSLIMVKYGLNFDYFRN